MDRKTLESYKEQYKDDLFKKVLPFWVNNGLDKKFGGIDTCLDRNGNVFSAEKSVWMQGRGGWLFAHLVNTFGPNEAFKTIAESALDFTKQYCIDPADGRLYFVVSSDGTPVRKRRYCFSEHFYIMANAEYYTLSHQEEYLEEAKKYHRLVLDGKILPTTRSR